MLSVGCYLEGGTRFKSSNRSSLEERVEWGLVFERDRVLSWRGVRAGDGLKDELGKVRFKWRSL